MRPTAPVRRYSRIAYDSGRARLLKLNMRVLPALSAASTISPTSAAFRAGGFSQKTCFPAARASMTKG